MTKENKTAIKNKDKKERKVDEESLKTKKNMITGQGRRKDKDKKKKRRRKRRKI